MLVFYAFTFVHCTAFYSPATEALINNNNNIPSIYRNAVRLNHLSILTTLRTSLIISTHVPSISYLHHLPLVETLAFDFVINYLIH